MIEHDYIPLDVSLQQVITPEQAWHYHIIPKSMNGSSLEFYIGDTEVNIALVSEELEILFGKSIKIEKVAVDLLKKSLGKYYRKAKNDKKSQSSFVENYHTEDFLSQLIHEAQATGSSDIHIEPYEERCRVRVRIDGKLIERYEINRTEYPALVNKIKIKANLDIAEKRLPQDGRLMYDVQDVKFDIRVSVLPTLHGEKIVMRLLSRSSTEIEISELGLDKKQLIDYKEGLRKTNGIILISGPTGSGKTTTLYATLKILNNEETNILTIEDPIEYTLEGVNQVQVKDSIGLTFASALRTFLRQDPDIIMLGEIRNTETAQMAIRAALTGHLVLSTIHTNSAWGTITRLVDMGVPSYLVANTINLTMAQRLVRLLCPECKEEQSIETSAFPSGFHLPKEIDKNFIPIGCEFCFYTGYRGRKAVFEIIPLNKDLENKIKSKDFEVTEILQENNIQTLSDQAFEMLSRGDTSLEEVYPILLNSVQ